jgi:quercetin dioxygenase-like cupin family protein
MNDFPEFMKNPANKIDPGSQFTKDIEGFVFNGADGSQMAYWTNPAGGKSAEHTHDYDEYMVVVQGQYTLIIGDKKYPIAPGDEFCIKKGTLHGGDSLPGTRMIHCFGGKRAERVKK